MRKSASGESEGSAIVSMRIPGPSWIGRTSPFVEAFAERHGLDFVSISEPILDLTVLRGRRRYRNMHLEKFQLFEILERYPRVIYVDADILIHPEAPNPLELVDPSCIGVVNEQVGIEEGKRLQEWKRMARRLGPLEYLPGRYFNAGVMVLSRAHRSLFANEGSRKFAAGRWPDQNTLNYRVQSERVSVQWLAPNWNCMPVFEEQFQEPGQRRKSWFIHYAGEPGKREMEEDLRYFEGLRASTC